MDDKKDVRLARGIFIKGISCAALKNPKLAAILEFIVKELNKQFPDDDNNNPNLN